MCPVNVVLGTGVLLEPLVMPRTGSSATMRVEEQELAESLEQMPMGGRRLPCMMPVTSRNPAYGHFINSIFHGHQD